MNNKAIAKQLLRLASRLITANEMTELWETPAEEMSDPPDRFRGSLHQYAKWLKEHEAALDASGLMDHLPGSHVLNMANKQKHIIWLLSIFDRQFKNKLPGPAKAAWNALWS